MMNSKMMKNRTKLFKIRNELRCDNTTKTNGPLMPVISLHAIGIRNNNTTKIKEDWHEINWKKAQVKIKDLQEKIVNATLNKNFREVYKLQWMIISCYEARILAVRRVITNKGKLTAGVDNITWKCSKDYLKAIKEIQAITQNPNSYKASPLKRVWIPKPGSKEKRPLGIPTMIDRAVQALYHLALDPVVETQSDPNSFGFRKFRSTHDAITAIRSHLDKSNHPRWILEADISKCFDKISHDFLMKHTHICHKMVLQQWLKSGVMEELNFEYTTEGTPQGGIISPTLCNIALNGLEAVIKKANPNIKGISAGVHVIRYADDMIITGKSQEIAIKNKNLLSEFLKERGLSLNEKKTVITNIKKGFDFLGFNIRRMDRNLRLNSFADQDTILIIKPSKKGIMKLVGTIQKIITMNKPLRKIISEANPVLRGWGEHKRISYHSQETFIRIDHWIQSKMRKWATRNKGSLRKSINKYLIQTANRKWNWGVSLKEKLINLAEISIIQIRPLKLDRNPYLTENNVYFQKRREKIIEAKFRAILYKKYDQTCPVCGESLHNEELVELHHIIPRKAQGKYSLENIVPLHQICHQKVTHDKKSEQELKNLLK